MICPVGAPHERVDDCETFECGECGKLLCSLKKLNTHRSSHNQSLCGFCGGLFAARNINQHVEVCRNDPDNKLKQVLPTVLWEERLIDFFEHCETKPPDTVCVMGDHFGPSFVTPAAACRMAAEPVEDEGVLVFIPVGLFPQLSTAARLRRREKTMTVSPTDFSEPGICLPGFGDVL